MVMSQIEVGLAWSLGGARLQACTSDRNDFPASAAEVSGWPQPLKRRLKNEYRICTPEGVLHPLGFGAYSNFLLTTPKAASSPDPISRIEPGSGANCRSS